MQRAERSMLASATNVANLAEPSATAVRSSTTGLVQTADPIEISKEAVELAMAKAQFQASLKVIQMDDELMRSALDLLG